MYLPGEVSQEVGRAYLNALTGCLEHTVSGFTRQFTVLSHPEKMTFRSPSGSSFSFDALASLKQPPLDCEILIESKGYENGSSLLSQYKDFLCKAYITTSLEYRHQRDLFWFVTNVPFGSRTGRRLTSPAWIFESLTEKRSSSSDNLLATAAIDRDQAHDLAKRTAVCILTDSFIKATGVRYTVQPGDNLWNIMELLHGGKVPVDPYQPFANAIAARNGLGDPDVIRAGETLTLPWHGVEW